MTIGVSCTAFSADSPEEWIIPIFEEFDHWEIFSEANHSVVHNTDVFRDILCSYDMSYSIHAPIADLNIAAMTPRLREASLKETLDTIRAASELDVGLVTVHPGLASMVVKGLESEALELAKAAMKPIEKASIEYGVTVAMENMPSVPFFLGRTASQLADIVDGTDLGICFDIGHANTMGEIDSMIELLGDRFVNIHIHDNNGDKDAHMTIGDGSIDFVTLLPRLKSYAGNHIIESKTFESAVESQERLEKLLY